MNLIVTEGYIPFRGYKTWYRRVGNGTVGRIPLLCLHGGPGMTHDYLETIETLAETGWDVVFYDQLGNGNSEQPHDPSMWTVSLFVEEVGAVRKALGLDEIHLLGQSWGGFLAQEYTLTQPGGVRSLILANSAASTARWIDEADRLRAELPIDVQQTLQKHEAEGTYDQPEYAAAAEIYYRRHLCRVNPWPDCLSRTLEKQAKNPEVYESMWGPSEFHCTGVLKNWNIENRIGEITIPTLILSGRHDESTPAINAILHQKIPGSEWIVFEESSHTPHLEETERYLQVVVSFLERIKPGN